MLVEVVVSGKYSWAKGLGSPESSSGVCAAEREVGGRKVILCFPTVQFAVEPRLNLREGVESHLGKF